MELEPITRQEQIIAGKDLEPITRMEKFLKQYGGGSGGGASQFVVTFNVADMQNWTCDKTLAEITEAINSGEEVVGSIAGEIKVDFIGQNPNGSVKFGRVFPDGSSLMSYCIVVFEDKVEVIVAYIEMTAMGG